jgi:hypothetical protein
MCGFIHNKMTPTHEALLTHMHTHTHARARTHTHTHTHNTHIHTPKVTRTHEAVRVHALLEGSPAWYAQVLALKCT